MQVSAAVLALALTHVLQLTGMLQWWTRQTVEVENNMTSVERMVEYINLPQEPPRWAHMWLYVQPFGLLLASHCATTTLHQSRAADAALSTFRFVAPVRLHQTALAARTVSSQQAQCLSAMMPWQRVQGSQDPGALVRVLEGFV